MSAELSETELPQMLPIDSAERSRGAVASATTLPCCCAVPSSFFAARAVGALTLGLAQVKGANTIGLHRHVNPGAARNSPGPVRPPADNHLTRHN